MSYLAKPKTFFVILGLSLVFSSTAFAKTAPEQKASLKPTKFILPPPIKLPLFKVNRPVRFKNAPLLVLAGVKLPNTSIYVNNKLAVPANKYTSWYYELSVTASTDKILLSSAPITSISQLRNATIIKKGLKDSLDVDPPRLFGYRFDPVTRDFIFDIQDPPGVLSYNIYYANSLNGLPATSPFILAQRDVPVSGTGTTTWRDNGTYTGSHPSTVPMRFYKVEVNRVDLNYFLITGTTPADNSSFLAGAKISIQPHVLNPDHDALLYQFSIGGSVVQAWASLDTYLWQTSATDTGTVSITCEVKDTKNRQISKTISCRILNPTIDDILQKVADNYALILDYKADMTLSSILNGQAFGTEQYLLYYFKAPHKEKTETYSDASRTTKTDIIITDGSNMHLIDPVRNIKQTVDLLTDAGVDAKQFAQVDIYYNKALFLSEHNITKTNSSSGTDMLAVLEATPKSPSKTYDKLIIQIDYAKGIITAHAIYKRNDTGQLELIQELKTIQSQKFPNGAWLPVKMTKQPNLTSGTFISTATYANIRLNTGLTDSDFDPTRQ